MSYVQPGILFILILMAFGVLRARATGRARTILILAFILLFLWSWMPAAWLFSATLEWLYPPLPETRLDAEAMVVLGAGSYTSNRSLPVPLLAEDSYARCRYAAWLYQKLNLSIPVVVSGGIVGAGVSGKETSLAKLMADVLVAHGVNRDVILLEPDSLSTYENAVNTARLLHGLRLSRILLVTGGAHMLRAERCFRKQGLAVIPAPCCLYTRSALFDRWSMVPGPRAMRQNEAILHEWVGLAWYWLSGRC
jgi:uncharacterized SAM-binding protein YcdF (DUF218 family)